MLCWPRGLSLTGRNAFIRKYNDSLNWKLRPPSGHLGFLMPLNQQVKKRVKVLAEVTDFDYQEEIGLLLNNEVRKSMSIIQEIF